MLILSIMVPVLLGLGILLVKEIKNRNLLLTVTGSAWLLLLSLVWAWYLAVRQSCFCSPLERIWTFTSGWIP